MTRERRAEPARDREGFDARDVLTGDLDDVSLRQAVEGHP
ncbi:hypothetical protein SAMN04487937_2231 [Halorubrum sodomense]|uniref:Uncharacterized protein n=1 Tax=Halorubrum sodomense TaxID=35743 RepID=A0A1I6H0B6_HALSD|nr:hypothetical protein SAMN04487937_2231 [Halorubrum sodomense]